MDERDWTDTPLTRDAPLIIGATRVTLRAPPQFAWRITGALDAALATVAPKVTVLGFGEDIAGAQSYAIRIARDSALLVTPGELAEGWHAPGYAISAAQDVYARLDISGPEAAFILGQGGIVGTDTSPSAATLFAGLTVLLVRDGAAFALWVPAADLTYATSFLRGCAAR